MCALSFLLKPFQRFFLSSTEKPLKRLQEEEKSPENHHDESRCQGKVPECEKILTQHYTGCCTEPGCDYRFWDRRLKYSGHIQDVQHLTLLSRENSSGGTGNSSRIGSHMDFSQAN